MFVILEITIELLVPYLIVANESDEWFDPNRSGIKWKNDVLEEQ